MHKQGDSDRISFKKQLSIFKEITMKKWRCILCGFIYDEAEGLPEDGIAPGTLWEDIPDDWECVDCGASKENFEMEEI